MSSPVASKSKSWRRVQRDILSVVLLLLTLELVLRLPPIADRIEKKLANFELLFRYDRYLPGYERELRGEYGGNHNLWMFGSSYMMTSLNPELIQAHVQANGLTDITIQNYGLTRLRNLDVMGQVIEADLLKLGQPRYVVLGVGALNFVEEAFTFAPILDSPYESAIILPDSIDEYVTGFMYRYSRLYRYTVLLQPFLSFDSSQALTPFLPLGGYAERHRESNCTLQRDTSRQTPPDDFAFDEGLQYLDNFIDRLLAHDIQVMVINIPIPACTLYGEYDFGNFENYQVQYLQPLAQHLSDKELAFYELDTRFFAEVLETEHGLYYDDRHHSNKVGAALFSNWAADYITDWLNTSQ